MLLLTLQLSHYYYITHDYDATFHKLDVGRTPKVNRCLQNVPWLVFRMHEPALENAYANSLRMQTLSYEFATISVTG